MGKNLKGKELGKGISQRKDGLYTARFTKRNGKRVQKYFNKLQDCRAWIAEEQFKDEHSSLEVMENMTVEAWFEYWIDEAKSRTIRASTKNQYIMQYRRYIQPMIGDMLLSEIRTVHCQKVLNKMVDIDLKQKSINDLRITLHSLFQYAVDNGVIAKNPVTKSVKSRSKISTIKKEVLTLKEQRDFLDALSKSEYDEIYGNQFRLILQTGLRYGEMTALKWDDIDFANKVIHITKSMNIKYPEQQWVTEKPKTEAGIRDIPLTDEAVSILLGQKQKRKKTSIIPFEFAEQVFLSKRGNPIANAAYNQTITKICKENDLRNFSLHMLRHTFATRCIEAGMKPKTLQKIMGHSTLSMTMDLYVHITEDEKCKEMNEIQNYLQVV